MVFHEITDPQMPADLQSIIKKLRQYLTRARFKWYSKKKHRPFYIF